MFEDLAFESNKYIHQKRGENLEATAKEQEMFVGLYFHMGLVKMPSVSSYWETCIHYPPVAVVVSSYLAAEPVESVQGYKSKKEHLSVDRPHVIRVYNKGMGGADLMVMMCILYNYKLRSKRWYMYIFYHTLTIALANAWFLYKRDCKIMEHHKSNIHEKVSGSCGLSLVLCRNVSTWSPISCLKCQKRKS